MKKGEEGSLKDMLFGSLKFLFSNGQLFLPLILLSIFKIGITLLPIYYSWLMTYPELSSFDAKFWIFALFVWIIRFLLYSWVFVAIGTSMREEKVSIFKQIPSALRMAKTGFLPIVSLYAIASSLAWAAHTMGSLSQNSSLYWVVMILKSLMITAMVFLAVYAAVVVTVLIVTGMGGWSSLEKAGRFLFSKKYLIIKVLLISFGLYLFFVMLPFIILGMFQIGVLGEMNPEYVILNVIISQVVIEVPLIILIGVLLIFYSKVYAKESGTLQERTGKQVSKKAENRKNTAKKRRRRSKK